MRLLTCLLVLALAGAALGRPHVVVISIDGLRPVFYQEPGWDAPNLKRLIRDGAWAEAMEPVFPTITYANHTSLITGVRPARHGINSNTAFDPERGPLTSWNFEASRIQVPTLWDLARAAGETTAAFSWPVSLRAPVDWLVPEVFHVPGVDNSTTPELVRQNSTPGLMEEIQAAAPGPVPHDFPTWDAWLPGAVGAAWRNHHPNLTLVHMVNMDFTQHHQGPESAAAHANLTKLDANLGKLLANFDPREVTVLVLGDHGFASYDRFVSPNRLLVDQGWVTLKAGQIESWRVVAQTNGGSAGIYCKAPELAEPAVKLLREHAAGLYRVLDRAELDRLGAFPGAICALVAESGVGLRPAVDKPLVEPLPAPLGNHGYLPERMPTGFLAWGAGVAPGRALGRVRVLDVAPTVASLLGLPWSGMEGHPIVLGPLATCR